ncbi:unnamed protein product [Paramecium pentaurelia]|uniref:Cytosolic Fe-S cluster assembly factor NUBP1 homolog n=1 Tax=Paramecium pentaurelia TaxID=43138 RepID=A0A8S1W997_9CILI|nr:unnamed protein product [Paramecium pentaurelia]
MQSNQNIPENANEHCPGANSDQAGKSEACSGCPNQQLCQQGAGKQLLDNSEIIENLKQVKHKILVLSGKGGVGKSTVSSQLAHILASKGFDVGLLDIDICGPSIPRMMGLETSEVHSSNNGWQPIYINENLGVMSIGFLIDNKDEAIIWRGPRKNGLIKQFLTDVAWGELDFLIIDTPPGTSDEHISIVQYLSLTPNDGAVIVTTPQEVSLSDVRKEISFCQKTKTNILGVVENMSGFVCPNCQHHTDIFHPTTGGGDSLCKQYELQLLGKIPLEPKVLLSAEKGKCIYETAPDSVAAQIYTTIHCQKHQKNNQNNDQYYNYMQTRYPRHQITQSVINIQPPQVTVVRSISPVVVRTLEVPVYYQNDQTNWKDKYYELRHQYWLLEDKCSKLEELQIKHSRCEVVRESELKQINELFTQSQYDIKQLKHCLAKVDTQMNEDYKLKYQQANDQLESIKSEFIKLQQELYQSQQQSTQNTQRQPQQINQLIISNAELQRQNEQLQLINKNLQQQIDTLHIRYTESGNQYNKIQELLALTVLKNAEIDSLRVLVSEKEKMIQQLRTQYLSQYR